MICARQVHEIERHWSDIADRTVQHLDAELTPYYAHKIPAALVRERVEDLLGHLSNWLSSADDERVAQKYEDVGRQRASEGIPLHEFVRVLQVIRHMALNYSLEHDTLDDRFAVYVESDLALRIANFFDAATFHAVRGYELALKGAKAAA